MNVQIFVPCFIDQLYPDIAFNMVKVLKKAGCTVHYNTAQTCCGQPAFNAGFHGEAKEVCTKFLQDFEGADYIIAPSASCVGFVKNYYKQVFENSAHKTQAAKTAERIFEFSDFLVNVLKETNFGAVLTEKATYHDSCAALRECKIKNEPRQLLNNVSGLELVEMNDVETCCGFGGTFAVKFEPISIAMGNQKINNASNTGATLLISTDMSCLMHIDGCAKHEGKPMRMMHLADVLASGW
ncbi:MAG: Fe-S oxidoreductase [Sphingobacteriia bacterium 24-36-13]|jgi:L-lactate dehydrogenase complex protein LldE|uniref:(Fe-S)-binding protein n=1 Tax=Sediminibacterium sp. TaxID=1917865 RepID=UPI000BD8D3AA|nr:(Fe-S)-binding protein [Sediminibacterium sp.]OYY12144.1 MAG: Fe-S oxidoreductase [Sphingobacteriia bacterium 35-36-14]OYZ55680.1 MAG: Fe-S oxidoreductase [Sphingobacteriia bacterium 24-36-13]OZA65397.1 MAG: Fe-S oxidoreductase [Sphingobacteriia bacterium 39-36-14]HQS23246.1 (Fe-S)-binding protein [Sediminibacterium sp.]HQS34773.1 (Fe-S)-binding protein [Sediminibacterium sp.]